MERFDMDRLLATTFDPTFFGDWMHQKNSLRDIFIANKPYPHLVIDNFFSPEIAEKISKDFPNNQWEGWFSYYNPIEIKRACDNLDKMPFSIQQALYQLNCLGFVNVMKELTDIPNLEMDPYLHGGGLHSIPRNGKLNLHLDYSIHPHSGKERRINIIIYMNKDWQEEWNGNLELWGAELDKCQKKVVPGFNRAAIFQTFDESWHGHPHRLECPEDQARKSLAVYYVSEARENATLRKKAHFIQTPGEPTDERIQKLLEIRDVRSLTSSDVQEIFPDWENACFSACSKD